jgi:hypothetical protein
MEHFVVYHNSDKQGRHFNDDRTIRKGHKGIWDTSKRYLEQTLVGNYLWGIQGGGSPKRYHLVSFGIITGVKRKKGSHSSVEFHADASMLPVEVTKASWLSKLRTEQNSFSFGLSKIRNRSVISALQSLRRKVISDIGSRRHSKLGTRGLKDSKASVPEELTDEEFREGGAVQVLVNRYERDPGARQRCIEHYGDKCVVCNIALSDRYGSEVEGLIHVHHLKPIANVGKNTEIDPIRDLRPVCPNCHAVIHSTKPPKTILQVKKMVVSQLNKRRRSR